MWVISSVFSLHSWGSDEGRDHNRKGCWIQSVIIETSGENDCWRMRELQHIWKGRMPLLVFPLTVASQDLFLAVIIVPPTLFSFSTDFKIWYYPYPVSPEVASLSKLLGLLGWGWVIGHFLRENTFNVCIPIWLVVLLLLVCFWAFIQNKEKACSRGGHIWTGSLDIPGPLHMHLLQVQWTSV